MRLSFPTEGWDQDRVVAGSQAASAAAAAPTAIFYLSQKFRMLTSLLHSTVLHAITCCKPSTGTAFELLRTCKSFTGCIIPARGAYIHKYIDVLLLRPKIRTQHYQIYKITALLSMNNCPELGYNPSIQSTNYNEF